MVIEMLLIGLLLALVVIGAAVGIGLVARTLRASAGAALEADSMTPRLVCEVHAGEEQVLIHLVRSLALPVARDDVGYGEVYLAGSAGGTLRLATRSEIGRGFDGEIRVHRTRRSSVAEYYLLRVPADESVRSRIAALDDRIAAAARSIDAQAQVRRTGERRTSARSMDASLG